jgi:hypothetical protein
MVEAYAARPSNSAREVRADTSALPHPTLVAREGGALRGIELVARDPAGDGVGVILVEDAEVHEDRAAVPLAWHTGAEVFTGGAVAAILPP